MAGSLKNSVRVLQHQNGSCFLKFLNQEVEFDFILPRCRFQDEIPISITTYL